MHENDPSSQSEATTGRREDDDLLLEKRGFTWGLLVLLLIATLVGALVLAYLITRHNFPAH